MLFYTPLFAFPLRLSLRLGTLLFCIHFAALNAWSEEQESFVHSLTAAQKKLFDYSQLQYGMLESRSMRDLTNDLRSQMVFALESLVQVACMHRAETALTYEGPPQGKECLTYLQRLEELHSENPVALCARHGLSSSSCKDAYQDQIVTTYYEDRSNPVIQDSPSLRARMLAPSETSKKKGKHPNFLRREYEKTPTPSARRALEHAYVTTIARECNPIVQRLQYEKPENVAKIEFKHESQNRSPSDDLSELIEDFDAERSGTASADDVLTKKQQTLEYRNDYASLSTQKGEDTPAPLAKAWRLRLITKNCKRAIGNALAYDVQFPTALCYMHGFTAPSCIAAQKTHQERKKRQEAAKPQGVGTEKPKKVFTEF